MVIQGNALQVHVFTFGSNDKNLNGMEIVTFYIHVYVLFPLHFKSWDVINDTFM
jgi:hypothetical protein